MSSPEQKEKDTAELLEALRRRYPDAYRHIVGLIRSLLK